MTIFSGKEGKEVVSAHMFKSVSLFLVFSVQRKMHIVQGLSSCHVCYIFFFVNCFVVNSFSKMTFHIGAFYSRLCVAVSFAVGTYRMNFSRHWIFFNALMFTFNALVLLSMGLFSFSLSTRWILISTR